MNMGTFLVYILKSAACLAVFYLFYKLLMSRDTFHRFNRFALLGLLVLSSLLPLVEVSVNRPAPVHETMLTLEQLLLLADVQAEGEIVSQPTTALWVRVALLVYLAGAWLCWSIWRALSSLPCVTSGRWVGWVSCFVVAVWSGWLTGCRAGWRM